MRPTRFLFLVAIFSMALVRCGQTARTEQAVGFGEDVQESGLHVECLDEISAEKILGQQAELKETSSEKKPGSMQYKCTYSATAVDPKTQALGSLYYHFEKFEAIDDARKVFKDIVSGNTGQVGQSLVKDMGDEAWFHTDDQNFYLLMVRKDKSILRIKVNRITSFTSADQLKSIVKELAEKM